MTQKMKEDSDNPGMHHDDYGIIDDDVEKNGMKENEDFDGFHENEDVTSEDDWRAMRILMGFARMRILPERLARPIWIS